MHRLAFRVVQIDGSALVVVTLDLTQMHAQVVTELAELCFAGVLKAKLERCRKNDQMLFTAAGTLFSVFFSQLNCLTYHSYYLAERCHGTGAPPWSCFAAGPGTGGKTPTGTSPKE